MKKKLFAIFTAFSLFSVLISGCSGTTGSASAQPSASASETTSPQESVELNISAAASLTEALTEITKLYQAENPGVTLVCNFASSGTLQKQIEEGAPADVFFSAAQKQMDALEQETLIVADSRVDLLKNKIVLIVPKDSEKGITSFEDCLTDKVSMIGIGDPASVPAGQYAQEVFTSLNGWDVISAKANLGTDVKQVLSWTESGDVDCGVVYSTDAAGSENVKVVAEAPEGSHKPITYPAAVVAASKHQDAAQAFLDYLGTDEAQQVFASFGFSSAK